MDTSEQLVDAYLRSLGHSDIKYEPDGNVPPDFLVDRRIAVEVRRLNQNYVAPDGTPQGLEEAFIPLWQRLEGYLTKIGPARPLESWYVGITTRRPLESWKTIEPKLRRALLQFAAHPLRHEKRVPVTRHFEIDFTRAEKVYPTLFRLGGGADRDSGGFVLSEVHRNLEICITEKERKVAPYRSKYSEWWLVLPDHISLGFSQRDIRDFAAMPPLEHSWQKVVLVNPLDPMDAVEV